MERTEAEGRRGEEAGGRGRRSSVTILGTEVRAEHRRRR
jgi:hypothetical protein